MVLVVLWWWVLSPTKTKDIISLLYSVTHKEKVLSFLEPFRSLQLLACKLLVRLPKVIWTGSQSCWKTSLSLLNNVGQENDWRQNKLCLKKKKKLSNFQWFWTSPPLGLQSFCLLEAGLDPTPPAASTQQATTVLSWSCDLPVKGSMTEFLVLDQNKALCRSAYGLPVYCILYMLFLSYTFLIVHHTTIVYWYTY